MQRAFVEVVVLGLACGPLGVWILLLRRAYAAESLSHAMLPGLVLAALVGVPLVFGAAAGVLVAALGIALVGGDIGVAVVVSGLFGLGGILALGPETPPRLNELLFGDLLGLDNGDLGDPTPYPSPARRTRDGRAVVYVRPGPATVVTLSAPGVADVRLDLAVGVGVE